jgi:hypothetical protein
MTARTRYDDAILAAIAKSKVLGIRAGSGTHRIIGIWAVVVERRVFVRSWDVKANGWNHTLVEEPRGTVAIEGHEIPVRAVRTRSERLLKAIDEAYAKKYNTPASLKYVKGFRLKRRRETTTELIPLL